MCEEQEKFRFKYVTRFQSEETMSDHKQIFDVLYLTKAILHFCSFILAQKYSNKQGICLFKGMTFKWTSYRVQLVEGPNCRFNAALKCSI